MPRPTPPSRPSRIPGAVASARSVPGPAGGVLMPLGAGSVGVGVVAASAMAGNATSAPPTASATQVLTCVVRISPPQVKSGAGLVEAMASLRSTFDLPQLQREGQLASDDIGVSSSPGARAHRPPPDAPAHAGAGPRREGGRARDRRGSSSCSRSIVWSRCSRCTRASDPSRTSSRVSASWWSAPSSAPARWPSSSPRSPASGWTASPTRRGSSAASPSRGRRATSSSTATPRRRSDTMRPRSSRPTRPWRSITIASRRPTTSSARSSSAPCSCG